MNYKLLAYAQDFISFILQNLKDANKINSIIIFGSVVRGEATRESDIDLFIETKSHLEEEILKLKEEFYNSIKVKKYWSLFGIKNEFHCEIGDLDEWKDLEKSLTSQGIVLFGKYKSKKEAKLYYLFSIEQGKNRNRNISLWRKLYGYTQKANKKIYQKEGIIKEFEGEKIARGVFMIPSEHTQKILSFLKKNKIKHKIILFWKEQD